MSEFFRPERENKPHEDPNSTNFMDSEAKGRVLTGFIDEDRRAIEDRLESEDPRDQTFKREYLHTLAIELVRATDDPTKKIELGNIAESIYPRRLQEGTIPPLIDPKAIYRKLLVYLSALDLDHYRTSEFIADRRLQQYEKEAKEERKKTRGS